MWTHGTAAPNNRLLDEMRKSNVSAAGVFAGNVNSELPRAALRRHREFPPSLWDNSLIPDDHQMKNA
jgi:hypothetical protein